MKSLILITIIGIFILGCEAVRDDGTVIIPPVDDGIKDDEVVTSPPVEDDEKPEGVDNSEPTVEDDKPKEIVGFEGITQDQCKKFGGNWNECGSPCAGTDAEVCIQSCRTQCECSGIAGFACPDGFKCLLSGTIADEMGVCVRG
jgi:hypothetical protein